MGGGKAGPETAARAKASTARWAMTDRDGRYKGISKGTVTAIGQGATRLVRGLKIKQAGHHGAHLFQQLGVVFQGCF